MYAKWIELDGRFAFSESDNGGVVISTRERDDLIAGESAGLEIYADAKGAPALREPIPVPATRAQVEALRLIAYSDPQTGSDRRFAEAARMQAMGEDGWEDVRAAGVARYEEIQAEFPWPEVKK